ncbi:hypothetical protein ACFOYW_04835 [Gryllotalpicola reticulitermitis]|uniref:DNA/RNA endonuclease G n=1 Tax=Gryllotalpicola reticulitermitis TaxID=1184153 RepID=A0ABV8Q5D2_9MICO
MSTEDPYPYRRILRRETHSSRAVLATAIAIAVILLCLYVATEIILMMVSHTALLAAPQDMLIALSELGVTPTAMPMIVGILLAVLGLLLLIGALTPGRLARHQMPSRRAAVVVDNEVIASALARSAAHAGNMSPDNTAVSVSAHRATVHLTPASGTRVRRASVEQAVRDQLAAFELYPPVRASVVIAANGKVGT